jgi:hypothetical protein
LLTGTPGESILFETNFNFRTDSYQQHLHFIIAACNKDNRVLIIPVDSLRAKADRTTILQPGDHPFITHLSFMNYSQAKIVPLNHLNTLITEHKAKEDSPLDQAILDRIRNGVCRSDRTPDGVKDFYLDVLYNTLGT